MRASSILLAAAVASGVGVWLAMGAPERSTAETALDAPERGAGVPVEVIEIAPQTLRDVVRLRGATEAARRVEVRAETSGRIVSAPILKGARVAEGQALCRIADDDRAARLEKARAKLAEAEIDAGASQTLSRRGFSSNTSVAEDRAALADARAEIAAMELDIARTTIAAPFAGVLESDTAETGALMMPGEVCAVVISLDPITLVGFASENEVGRIRLGALATARLPDGARAQGAVSFVSRAADPATRTFRVEARGPNPAGPDQLRDGLTALIEVPLEARTAHRTPRVALTLDDAGRLGVRVVETAEGGGAVARFRPVRVLRDGPEGLFVAGLDGPTQVIVTGQEFVRDGAAVRATPRAEAPRD